MILDNDLNWTVKCEARARKLGFKVVQLLKVIDGKTEYVAHEVLIYKKGNWHKIPVQNIRE